MGLIEREGKHPKMCIRDRYGYWEAELKEGEYGRAESLEERSDLEEVLYKRSVGFSPLRDGQNEYKPYLYVEECTPQALARYPYRILEGRLPENDQELLISNHLISDGGVAWKVGDTVTLPLGQRERSGERLTNEDGFYKDYPEVWTQEQERTYTIVGIMARPGSENIMSPGYTAVSYLDMGTVQEQDMMNVGLIFKNPTRTLFSTCDELKQDLGFLKLTTNDEDVYKRQSDNRGVGPCILAMRMAFQRLTKLSENFKFIADGYSAYPLAAMEFAKKFGKDFTFKITQVIGLTNDDAVSAQHRPFKQMIERLNRTYKASYRHTNGFDNIDGANYDLALWVAYYNFLRPHKHNHYKVLNEVAKMCIRDRASSRPGRQVALWPR